MTPDLTVWRFYYEDKSLAGLLRSFLKKAKRKLQVDWQKATVVSLIYMQALPAGSVVARKRLYNFLGFARKL